MSKLPVISGLKVVKALKEVGYLLDHQTGSHMILRQVDYPYRRLTVPRHGSVAKGTLRVIIKQAGLTVPEFIKLLKK